MIYLTYDNLKLQDGIGAQTQRILSIYIIAKLHGWGYIHTPIIAVPHNITNDTLNVFNKDTHLPSDSLMDHHIIPMEFININKIKRCHSSSKNVIFRITFAHNYIDTHFDILSKPFPYRFDWIETNINDPISIMIHVRRGDVSQTQNNNRFVDLKYYTDCATQLHELLTQSGLQHNIHIHSEKSIMDEFTNIPDYIKLILDEPVNTVFRSFVNADILFTGFSSLSYSAMMLRRKGCVLYTPFWHRYPNQMICVNSPNDITLNYVKIVSCIKSA